MGEEMVGWVVVFGGGGWGCGLYGYGRGLICEEVCFFVFFWGCVFGIGGILG